MAKPKKSLRPAPPGQSKASNTSVGEQKLVTLTAIGRSPFDPLQGLKARAEAPKRIYAGLGPVRRLHTVKPRQSQCLEIAFYTPLRNADWIMPHMELESLFRQQQDLHKAGGLVHLVLT